MCPWPSGPVPTPRRVDSRATPTPIGTTPNTGDASPPKSASFSHGGCPWSSGNWQRDDPLNRDFVDLLRAFGAADVRFLIVGAYALAHHGRPRATGDLDVWIDPSPENAPRVMAALQAFGAPLQGVTEADFAQPSVVFQIGVAPGRIDILTELSGITFGEAWPERESGAFGSLTVDYTDVRPAPSPPGSSRE